MVHPLDKIIAELQSITKAQEENTIVYIDGEQIHASEARCFIKKANNILQGE